MIRVVIDNLATVRVDAMVRPASTTLKAVAPPIQDLEALGGSSFQNIKVNEELALGSAIVTDAGDLAAKMVIHAIVAVGEEQVSEDSVRRAMASILHRAAAWHMTTIGLPLTQTEFGGLSNERAATLMVSAIRSRDSAADYPRELVVVVSNEKDKKMVEGISGDLIT